MALKYSSKGELSHALRIQIQSDMYRNVFLSEVVARALHKQSHTSLGTMKSWQTRSVYFLELQCLDGTGRSLAERIFRARATGLLMPNMMLPAFAKLLL